jgi:hypothetical protein
MGYIMWNIRVMVIDELEGMWKEMGAAVGLETDIRKF